MDKTTEKVNAILRQDELAKKEKRLDAVIEELERKIEKEINWRRDYLSLGGESAFPVSYPRSRATEKLSSAILTIAEGE